MQVPMGEAREMTCATVTTITSGTTLRCIATKRKSFSLAGLCPSRRTNGLIAVQQNQAPTNVVRGCRSSHERRAIG